jgi:hypothetical protein
VRVLDPIDVSSFYLDLDRENFCRQGWSRTETAGGQSKSDGQQQEQPGEPVIFSGLD